MANMSLDDMKDTFLFNDGHETSQKMLDYIQNVLGITESGRWNYMGYDVVSVDPEEYERVLLEGRKYAIENDLGMWWIDCNNTRRAPIASMDIGFGILPETLLEGEPVGNDRHIWDIPDANPPIIVDYFAKMQEYFGKEIIRVDKKYWSDNGMTITPVTKDIDFEKYQNLLAEFIIEHGTGPFTEIHPLTFTGKYIEEPFQKVKK